jgi:chromosome segregation ATPase
MTKNTEKKTINTDYGFYSRVLKEPFDTIEELAEAEEAYYAKLKAKEDAAAQKKADATKVEEAFKALNAARKAYKEERATLTKEYSEALADLKKAFEAGVADIHNTLAAAEETYSAALKEFTDKYQQYHITLKDGDFETTISSSQSKMSNDKLEADRKVVSDLFSLLFGAL